MNKILLGLVFFASPLFSAAVMPEDVKQEDFATQYKVCDFNYERDSKFVQAMFEEQEWLDREAFGAVCDDSSYRKVLIDKTTKDCCGFAYYSLNKGFSYERVYNVTDGSECNLNNFVIIQKLRRKGLGSFFFKKILDHMKHKLKAAAVALHSEDDALNFYKRHGFLVEQGTLCSKLLDK